MKKVRIVAAVPHNDSDELEVILETREQITQFTTETVLHSVWLDAHKLLDMVHK
jgi:hypothetical protein